MLLVAFFQRFEMIFSYACNEGVLELPKLLVIIKSVIQRPVCSIKVVCNEVVSTHKLKKFLLVDVFRSSAIKGAKGFNVKIRYNLDD